MGGKWNKYSRAQKRVWANLSLREKRERIARMNAGRRLQAGKDRKVFRGKDYTATLFTSGSGGIIAPQKYEASAKRVTVTITME